MARKKKKEPEAVYVIAGQRDYLVHLSLKHNIPLDKLRALNPDIKNIFFKIPTGRKVRID